MDKNEKRKKNRNKAKHCIPCGFEVSGSHWARHVATVHKKVPPAFVLCRKRPAPDPTSSLEPLVTATQSEKSPKKLRRDIDKFCRLCRETITGQNWKRHVKNVHGGKERFKLAKPRIMDTRPSFINASEPSAPLAAKEDTPPNPLGVSTLLGPLAAREDTPPNPLGVSTLLGPLAAREDTPPNPFDVSTLPCPLAAKEDTPSTLFDKDKPSVLLAAREGMPFGPFDTNKPLAPAATKMGTPLSLADTRMPLARLAAKEDTPSTLFDKGKPSVLLAAREDTFVSPFVTSKPPAHVATREDEKGELGPFRAAGTSCGRQDVPDHTLCPSANTKRCNYPSCSTLCRGANTKCWKHNESRMAMARNRTRNWRKQRATSQFTTASMDTTRHLEPTSRSCSETPFVLDKSYSIQRIECQKPSLEAEVVPEQPSLQVPASAAKQGAEYQKPSRSRSRPRVTHPSGFSQRQKATALKSTTTWPCMFDLKSNFELYQPKGLCNDKAKLKHRDIVMEARKITQSLRVRRPTKKTHEGSKATSRFDKKMEASRAQIRSLNGMTAAIVKAKANVSTLLREAKQTMTENLANTSLAEHDIKQLQVQVAWLEDGKTQFCEALKETKRLIATITKRRWCAKANEGATAKRILLLEAAMKEADSKIQAYYDSTRDMEQKMKGARNLETLKASKGHTRALSMMGGSDLVNDLPPLAPPYVSQDPKTCQLQFWTPGGPESDEEFFKENIKGPLPHKAGRDAALADECFEGT